jgi:hypothetical protein
MNELELLLPQARPAVNWAKKSHVNAACPLFSGCPWY